MAGPIEGDNGRPTAVLNNPTFGATNLGYHKTHSSHELG